MRYSNVLTLRREGKDVWGKGKIGLNFICNDKFIYKGREGREEEREEGYNSTDQCMDSWGQ